MRFKLTSWSGSEVWKNWLPWSLQVKLAAKRLMRSVWKDADPVNDKIIIDSPIGPFRIIDKDGRLEPTEDKLVIPLL